MQLASAKTVVLVLGMHRSGTSTITRGLAAIGVDLGDNLMLPIKGNNDKGFFEDLDINKLSIEILDSIGHDWDSIRPIPDEQLEGICRNESFREKAKSIISAKIAYKSIFGIKNPRVSRLVPFWLQVLSELGVDVRLVIACRNPISVAASLQRRNDFPYIKSFYMWLDHNLSSLFYTKDLPRIVVDYDKLVDQPRAQITRIAKYLSLSDNFDENSLSEYASKFIDQDLRHARHSTKEIEVSCSTPHDVVALYRIMCTMADSVPGEIDGTDYTLQKVRESHIRNTPALTLFDHSENLREKERVDAYEKIEGLKGQQRLLMEERDMLCCKFSEASTSLSSLQAEFKTMKQASANIQEALINKLEASCKDLGWKNSELARIQESKVYKYLSRFM